MTEWSERTYVRYVVKSWAESRMAREIFFSTAESSLWCKPVVNDKIAYRI